MISVITINYNDVSGLENTIASVSQQTCTTKEHLIIDGGSTDGSVAFIDKHKEQFSYTVSEKDNGVYHAMNKGIKAATGDYVFFLNAGDVFFDDEVLAVFDKKFRNQKDIYYGDINLVDGKGKQKVLLTPRELSFEFFFRRTIPHQAALIKRSLFEDVFYYNESYRIISDWEFFAVALCKQNASYEHVGITVANYDTNGMSSVPENKKRFREEKRVALKEHFSMFVSDYELLRKQKTILNKRVFKDLFIIRNNKIGVKLIGICLRIVKVFGVSK